MQKLTFLSLLLGVSISGFAQHLGAPKKTIIDAEKKIGSEWKKTEGSEIEAVNGAVNTFYYFNKAGKCTNIVKMTNKAGMVELKKYLSDNKFVYDTESSQYKRDNLVGIFQSNSQMVTLKITKDPNLVAKK